MCYGVSSSLGIHLQVIVCLYTLVCWRKILWNTKIFTMHIGGKAHIHFVKTTVAGVGDLIVHCFGDKKNYSFF